VLCRAAQVGQFFVTLLVQLEELEDRKAMLKKLIQVAEECLHIHNFNALMALVSGLSSTSVSRLTKTWEALGSKVLLLAPFFFLPHSTLTRP
jgi:son of sevenless-like protein